MDDKEKRLLKELLGIEEIREYENCLCPFLGKPCIERECSLFVDYAHPIDKNGLAMEFTGCALVCIACSTFPIMVEGERKKRE